MKKILKSLIPIALLLTPLVALAAPPQDVIRILGVLLTDLRAVVFAAAGVFVVVAAFQFLTAGGDEEKVTEARQKVVYALVAVVVALLASGLVTWVSTL